MYYVGVDLGGTNIAVGIVTYEGKIIAKKSVKTMADRPFEEIIKDMADCTTSLLEENNIVYMLEGQDYNYVLDINNEKILNIIEMANLNIDNFKEDWDKDTVKVSKIIAVAYNEKTFDLVCQRFKEEGYSFMCNLSNGKLFEIYKSK